MTNGPKVRSCSTLIFTLFILKYTYSILSTLLVQVESSRYHTERNKQVCPISYPSPTQFTLFYDVQCNLRLKALERETKLYA